MAPGGSRRRFFIDFGYLWGVPGDATTANLESIVALFGYFSGARVEFLSLGVKLVPEGSKKRDLQRSPMWLIHSK